MLEDVGGPASSTPRGNAKPGQAQIVLWIAVGAAAAGGVLIVAGTVFLLLNSGKIPDSSRSTVAQTSEPPMLVKPEPPNKEPSPVITTSLPKPESPPRAPKAAPSQKTPPPVEQPKQKTQEPTSERTTVASDAPPPVKLGPNSVADAAAEAARSVPSRARAGVFAGNEFDVSRLSRRPRQLEYSVGKNLDRARSHRGEIVVPGGMYCLKPSITEAPGGIRKFLVTEVSLEEQGSKRMLRLAAQGSAELEVDPRLAAHLDALDDHMLNNSVAALTLWINDKGEFALVRGRIP